MPGMEDFQFLLHDLAVAFQQDAYWRGVAVPGRFYIDPFVAPTAPIEPGVGVTQIMWHCDRLVMPKPWPTLGDHLTINNQVYEIVERGEDDIGELAYRLIREELGISRVVSEGGNISTGTFSTGEAGTAHHHYAPGRPTRRRRIESAFEDALAADEIDPEWSVQQIIDTMRPRLGNGQGLRDKTLLKIVGRLARARRSE